MKEKFSIMFNKVFRKLFNFRLSTLNLRLPKVAFTLGEIMITLGIVGTTAAITLPPLINNHRAEVLKAQYKTAYSTISEAYALAASNFKYVPACYYPYNRIEHHCVEFDNNNKCTRYETMDGKPLPANINGPNVDCNKFLNKLVNSVKVVKQCDNNAFANGCIPKYKGIDTVLKEVYGYTDDAAARSVSGCLNFASGYIDKRQAYVLSNGVIYILYGNPKLFALDINGFKGPNKWGHDLFAFEVVGDINSMKIRPGGCGSNVYEPGGVNSYAMQAYVNGMCKNPKECNEKYSVYNMQ